jgi:hypothetical protein
VGFAKIQGRDLWCHWHLKPKLSTLRGAETLTDTVTTGKRGRKSSVILTDRLCETRVDKRTKIYDRKCQGLYVSITTAGVATFNYKFTSPETGKQRTAWLGIFNPETFKVETARSKVYGLKANGGTAIAETLRQHKVQKVKHGKTVDEIIEERIEWMKTPVMKRDGEMRPRIESWANVSRHLRGFIGARLGKKIASEVSKNDIATLSNDMLREPDNFSSIGFIEPTAAFANVDRDQTTVFGHRKHAR